MIAITHTHDDGTSATGTAKGDGTGDILKGNRFTWRYGAWRIRGSRARIADMDHPQRWIIARRDPRQLTSLYSRDALTGQER